MKKVFIFFSILIVLFITNIVVYAYSYTANQYNYTDSNNTSRKLDYILNYDLFKYKIDNVTSVRNIGPSNYPYDIREISFTPSSEYEFYVLTLLRFSGGTGYESMNLERTQISGDSNSTYDYYLIGSSSNNSSNDSSGASRSYLVVPKTKNEITIRAYGDLDGIGVYGLSLGSEVYTPNPDDLGFTPIDPSWGVTNVSGAISYIKSHNKEMLSIDDSTLVKKETNKSEASFTPEDEYNFYILNAYISRVPTGYYSTLNANLDITNITNASLFKSGDIGNDAGGSCGTAKSWLIIPTNGNQIDLTFKSTFSSYTISL